ncbi:MAG: hypothetical protein COZ38_08335 [Rhodocyclales bacterium CG_4_10_14_3_um_filter_68_10]|nr:MAG: hypothetical protein COZ38_08335 [Rhodocyclales bacterium CG_4_10_14_3_um_filter_68_10]
MDDHEDSDSPSDIPNEPPSGEHDVEAADPTPEVAPDPLQRVTAERDRMREQLLRTAADFERFSGSRVHVRLHVPVGGRRNFTGVLKGAAGGSLLLDCDGTAREIDLEQVAKVRLVPAYDGIGNGHGGR